MKKLLIIMIMICLISGCGKQSEVPAVSETPAMDEAGESGSNESRVIYPLPCTVDMENLDNCTLAVSLEKGKAYVDDTGKMVMELSVYDYELYDMVDISLMKEGDILMRLGEEFPIESLEHSESGAYTVNGGIEKGGIYLVPGDGVFYEMGMNDAREYYKLGEATIPVHADFLFYDNADPDVEKVFYPGDFLYEDAGIMYYFSPHNTSVVIENGKIVRMDRIYTP